MSSARRLFVVACPAAGSGLLHDFERRSPHNKYRSTHRQQGIASALLESASAFLEIASEQSVVKYSEKQCVT